MTSCPSGEVVHCGELLREFQMSGCPSSGAGRCEFIWLTRSATLCRRLPPSLPPCNPIPLGSAGILGRSTSSSVFVSIRAVSIDRKL